MPELWLYLLPGRWHGVTFRSQVGCFYAHPVVDIPPYMISPAPPELWGATYRSWAIVYDCSGDRLGMALLGVEGKRGLKWDVIDSYKNAIEDIKETVPSFNTFIDIRTLKMMKAGCCPHMLLEEED